MADNTDSRIILKAKNSVLLTAFQGDLDAVLDPFKSKIPPNESLDVTIETNEEWREGSTRRFLTRLQLQLQRAIESRSDQEMSFSGGIRGLIRWVNNNTASGDDSDDLESGVLRDNNVSCYNEVVDTVTSTSGFDTVAEGISPSSPRLRNPRLASGLAEIQRTIGRKIDALRYDVASQITDLIANTVQGSLSSSDHAVIATALLKFGLVLVDDRVEVTPQEQDVTSSEDLQNAARARLTALIEPVLKSELSEALAGVKVEGGFADWLQKLQQTDDCEFTDTVEFAAVFQVLKNFAIRTFGTAFIDFANQILNCLHDKQISKDSAQSVVMTLRDFSHATGAVITLGGTPVSVSAKLDPRYRNARFSVKELGETARPLVTKPNLKNVKFSHPPLE